MAVFWAGLKTTGRIFRRNRGIPPRPNCAAQYFSRHNYPIVMRKITVGNIMKNIRLLSAVLASALLVSPSFAQDLSSATAAPLAPGKPAGVHQAAIGTSTIYGIAILALIAGGVAIIVTNEGTQKSSTTATTPTP
jgi:hypothetical protein